MEKAPQISVIIPVYNTEKYLKQCVDSVLNQSYQDFEIILVDDGSKDSSGEICDDYSISDDRIHVIHKENGGQSSARNVALDNAQGKYIYFLDSDDYILNTLLEKLYNTAKINNADVVFFEAQSFVDDEENNLYAGIQNHFEYVRKNKYEKCNGQKQFLNLVNNKEYYVCTPLHFYKKEYLDLNNIRFKEGIIHEDNLFSANVYMCDGITVHLLCRDYMRRLHTNSTMTTIDENHLLFRYNSLVTVFFEDCKIIEKYHPVSEIIRTLINDSVDSVIYSFQMLSYETQKSKLKSYKRVKRYSLIHFGIYDYQLARKCAGPILKPVIRGLHYIIKRKRK